MEPIRKSIPWKEVVIVALTLGVLASLLWLFLRPSRRARDIVFGDLGRRPVESNAVAGPQEGSPRSAPDAQAVRHEPAVTNDTAGIPSNPDRDNQTHGQAAAGPGSNDAGATQTSNTSRGTVPSNAVASTSNPPLSSPAPRSEPAPASHGNASPATQASARRNHIKPVPFADDSPPPEPAHKDSTASLLTAAEASGTGPERPTPARTVDLLGHDISLARMFDASAGSNVVFMLDNSLSMITNDSSDSARQAVAQTLESMNASQTFYVLLFHSGGYEGMPSLAPRPATAENIHAMTNWLFNVGHRTGSDPTKAMQRALGLTPAPDTVWLLSDSEIPNAVVDSVREANASVNARINTIAFHSRDGEEGLRRVAEENRGAYQFFPPSNPPAP